MEIRYIKTYNRFRGLEKGFELFFKNAFYRNEIDPICLAGLNGSGKSNVMELIAEVFYFIEALHHPSGQKFVNKKSQFGFIIEYGLHITINNILEGEEAYLAKNNITRTVRFDKPPGKTLKITHQIPGGEVAELNKENPSFNDILNKILPTHVIAYASGHNELISNPFIKMNYYYFDEFKNQAKISEESSDLENAYENIRRIDMNRMFYLDYDSNMFVLLANFLMKDKVEYGYIEQVDIYEREELSLLKQATDIEGIHSFQIVLNLQLKKDYSKETLKEIFVSSEYEISGDVGYHEVYYMLFEKLLIPDRLKSFISQLESCSTLANYEYESNSFPKRLRENEWIKLTLYYQVTEETKIAFQNTFKNAQDLFGKLYQLSLLNMTSHAVDLEEEVRQTKQDYTISERIPRLRKQDQAFYIDEFRLQKTSDKSHLNYFSLSDGEHQFLHVVGALMLMEEEGSIFLLDEPTTHFNPEWRSKFISIVNQIYINRTKRLIIGNQRMQWVVISSHSPFILSDTKKENVLWFEKNEKKTIAKELGFQTYGASIDYIMKRIRGENNLIANRAWEDLKETINDGNIEELRKAIEEYGESSQKQFLFRKLYELSEKNNEE